MCNGLPDGIPYRNSTNWDVGLGFARKQFTLDLRYFDNQPEQGRLQCFHGRSHREGVHQRAAIDTGGAGCNWCGTTFIAKISVDLTSANLK
jgi:hypothetical protein